MEEEGEMEPVMEERRTRRKRIPYTLVEASKGNHCPTPGPEYIHVVSLVYTLYSYC